MVGLPDLVVGSSCVLLTESPENTSDVNMTSMTSKGGREGEKNDKEAMLSWVRIGYRYLSHTSNLPAAASPLSFSEVRDSILQHHKIVRNKKV